MSAYDELEPDLYRLLDDGSNDYSGEYSDEHDISDRLDRLEAATEHLTGQEYSDEVGVDYGPLEGISAREHLAAVALAARQAVLDKAGVTAQPPPPISNDEVIAEARAIVEGAIPSWNDDEPAVVAYLQANGVDLSPAIQTGDANTVAKALFSAHTHVALGENARRSKQAAQTMSGSNVHTDPETQWDQIKAARGMPSFRQ